MNTNRIFSNVSLAAVAGVLGVGSALASGPVGELEARGHVDVAQQGADNAVRVSDTTYGWFSGDSVHTGSGQALLSLDDGASLGFGKNTAATVSVEDGAVVASLESGVLLYALEDQQVELKVESGDYRFSTRSAEAQPMQVSSGPRGAAGMIRVLESGQVQVSVHDGVMASTDVSGSLQYQVASGETVAFEGTEPRQVNTQVEAARRERDRDAAAAWFGNTPPEVLGMLAVIGGSGVYKVAFDDDDEDPQSVSP
ncbi:hypothetical protein [Wenzhouxiangella sediminis]|uniref:FecR protein domain-containing protein n=1 Tax=Wenzhouxiangella sediminis TaxID=1792836 RepID=A0A3E1KDH6_9GAMM|nr:hypothetical protein [Wenzhouxiangella sediminis]RFF32495.1 hypothetical protein DZC52_01430 [Wenzhouxiangella sediminis]